MLAEYFEQSEDEAMYRIEEFERKVKERFIKEPGQMKLLIVVDKLLTGFDAPSATYLYIDKPMRDHGLFQAICRVNRLDGDDKEYGYIIDYRDLFHPLEGAVVDYTSGALDAYDKEDVADLLTNRLDRAKERLEETLETVKALCEEVRAPKKQADYYAYFSAVDSADAETMQANEPKRVALYKSVISLLRAYANIAVEMEEAGYSPAEIAEIKREVRYYEKLRTEIKMHSGDHVDMKRYEPAMRRLLDTYIRADDSEVVADFEELGLIELIVEKGISALDGLPKGIKKNQEAVAETIENNIRKVIIDEQPVNPKYYENMSELLDALIEERRRGAIEYKAYLEKVKELSKQVVQPGTTGNISYPRTLNTRAKQALYDNLSKNEELALEVDAAIRNTKKDGFIGNRFKEREVLNAIREAVGDYEVDLDEVFRLVKEQRDYK